MLRHDASGVDVLGTAGEFLDDAADEAVFGMTGKDLQLTLTAVAAADVVGVHARDEFMLASLHAEVQRTAKALIFKQPADVQPFAEFSCISRMTVSSSFVRGPSQTRTKSSVGTVWP